MIKIRKNNDMMTTWAEHRGKPFPEVLRLALERQATSA